MKITNRKFLVAGLLAGALTFVGCKSSSSAERSGTTDTTQTPATGTGTDTTGTGTGTGTDTGTGTSTNPGGTGGSGNCGTGGSGGTGDISRTKQSDDNLRMPEDDPLRTKDRDTVRQGESEEGVHERSGVSPEPGTGGSGFNNDAVDDNLNEGGNIDERRTPASPADLTPDGVTKDSSQLPEGAR